MNDNYVHPEAEKKFDLPEPNPKTARQHREEFRRQILLPILMGSLILGILIAGIWVWGNSTTERWATISTIFLLLPLLLVGLAVLAILVFLILMLGEVMGVLPRYTRLAQNAVEKIKVQIEAGADISAKPVIQLRSYMAWIERLFGFAKKR